MTDIEKARIIRDAKAQGIVDTDNHNGGTSYETLKLATELTKKHAPRLYKELEERRKSQS